MIYPLLILLIFLKFTSSDDDTEITTESESFCRERNRLVSNDKDDLYNIVEAYEQEKVLLQCHFCNENDDDHPKIWYKLDMKNSSIKHEVKLGMENNMTLNRIRVTPDHTLIITNLTENDAGEYFCRGLDGDEVENKYNFYIDVIGFNTVKPEIGSLSLWTKYQEETFEPINRLLTRSTTKEYDYLRLTLRISLEMVTEWDEAGPCEICGKPKGQGERSKKGHCKLKVSQVGNIKIVGKNYHEKLLLRATHVSCRSMALKYLVPGIYNGTSVVPDFIEVEKCDGLCNPDAEGVYKGWKSTKKSGFKYKKTFVLAEDAHLTLICPDSTLENQVTWKINGHTIKAGESVEPSNVEPKVTVDTFNTLYLYGVTKDEEGNYTCYVDEVRMQQVRVFVVSKAKLLTQAFVRHMMYLAFVLSLTLSCYCAGLIVTWTRRRRFKSYQQLREDLKRENKLLDEDDEESPYDAPPENTNVVKTSETVELLDERSNKNVKY